MSKSMMFKKAHAIARKINSKVGNYAIAFKFALKKVWQMGKSWAPQNYSQKHGQCDL